MKKDLLFPHLELTYYAGEEWLRPEEIKALDRVGEYYYFGIVCVAGRAIKYKSKKPYAPQKGSKDIVNSYKPLIGIEDAQVALYYAIIKEGRCRLGDLPICFLSSSTVFIDNKRYKGKKAMRILSNNISPDTEIRISKKGKKVRIYL